MTKTQKDEALTDLIDQNIVIDMDGSMIIIGRLVRIASDCLVLEDADVHDITEGYSGKELYLIDSRKVGVRVNRQKVYVPHHKIVAISALDDCVID